MSKHIMYDAKACAYRAVGERDRASEGDEVTGRDTVLLDEGLLQLHDLVETDVGVERGLDVVEDHDGAVSTSTTAESDQ